MGKFTELRRKTYSYLVNDGSEDKKASQLNNIRKAFRKKR